MDQGGSNQNSIKVKEDGNVGVALQNGSHKVRDVQGIVHGPIDKSDNHVDNSKNQVINSKTFVKSFSFIYKIFLFTRNERLYS